MGLLQIAMATIRLGFVVDLLSHPVIVGFSAAAALIIAGSQVGAATSLDVVRTHRLDLIARDVAGQWNAVDLTTFGIFSASLVVLLLLARFAPKVPRALVVVVGSTLAVWWWGLDGHGVSVVGEIPDGLPELGLPAIDLDVVTELLPAAAIALLVGFTEAFSIAKVLSQGDRDVNVDANRELMGLGVANLASALVGGMAVGGALSRTTVAHRSGARTQVSILVAALVVVATLLFLTPAFRLLPQAALAAVIVVAVMGLVDLAEARRLWRVDRRDFGVVTITFAATLVLGVMWGVLVGVVTALTMFLSRVARPEVIRLQLEREGERRRWVPHADADEAPVSSARASERVPATDPPGSSRRHDPHEGIVVVRVQAPAFFANARYLQESINQLVTEDGAAIPHAVILDASAIDHLDASAELVLSELCEELEELGVELHLARVTTDVLDTIERSGLAKLLAGRLHDELEVALAALRVSLNLDAATSVRSGRAPSCAPGATEDRVTGEA